MGGLDERGVITADWMPPSPSPRPFFAAMLGDETGSRSGPRPAEDDNSNDGGFTFPWPDIPSVSENRTADQAMKTSEFDQKMGPRAGLVERIAARTGHNAPRLNTDVVKPVFSSHNQQPQSPYLTVSPGFSPGSFLESPVFLSNSLVQPSPTTGKFKFGTNDNSNVDRSKDNLFEESNNNSFALKPSQVSDPILCNHVNPSFMSAQTTQSNEAVIQPEKQFWAQKTEPSQNYSEFTEKNKLSLQTTPFEALNATSDRSQQHHEEQQDEINANIASSDDGYNWRKYGQKQVKGSEYPRSYYKCTHPNCPVKKKVERSFEGHITEIIYKGAHNHPNPNRRSGIGSSTVLNDIQAGGPWGQESNFEVTSGVKGQNGHFEPGDGVDGSLTFSNDEDDDDRVTHGSVSVGYDGEGEESESKRRKGEAYVAADVSGPTRSMREPRVVVQTTSDVDILDDGYRWRKYGQKVVKGNPNPRSYYKCTSTGCSVRKHVERASHDLKSVITTYEGKHNHEVPAARNSSSSHNNSTTAQVQKPESSRVQTTMARFNRPFYGVPNGQPLGPNPTQGYGYPMSQHGPGGLAHAAMANQGESHVLPLHYVNRPRHMGLMVPKGEPKVEPVSDPGLNLTNGSPFYHQMMSRLPLGHQM